LSYAGAPSPLRSILQIQGETKVLLVLPTMVPLDYVCIEIIFTIEYLRLKKFNVWTAFERLLKLNYLLLLKLAPNICLMNFINKKFENQKNYAHLVFNFLN
jgi:hypothetical protein